MFEKIQLMTLMFIGDLKAKRDERGATAVEYGLMVALIAAVIVATVGLLGTALDTKFQDRAHRDRRPPAELAPTHRCAAVPHRRVAPPLRTIPSTAKEAFDAPQDPRSRRLARRRGPEDERATSAAPPRSSTRSWSASSQPSSRSSVGCSGSGSTAVPQGLAGFP